MTDSATRSGNDSDSPYRLCRQAYSWCGGPDGEGSACSVCVRISAFERAANTENPTEEP